MSKQYDNPDWQLGMELPSRKEKHGRKKKDKKAKEEPPKLPERLAPQPNAEQDEPHADQEGSLPKQEGSPLVKREANLPKQEGNPLPEQEAKLPKQEDSPLAKQEAELSIQGPTATSGEPAPDGNETVADDTLVVNLRMVSTGKPSSAQEEAAPTPERLAARREVEAAQAETAAAATAVLSTPKDVVTQEEIDLLLQEQAEEVERQGRWQRRILAIVLPLALLTVLVWGKIGYVHNVPDLVRGQVSAFHQGQGFLILKPWWFGPPVFSLTDYMSYDVETLDRLKLKMGSYSEVLHDPLVIWTFESDVLK